MEQGSTCDPAEAGVEVVHLTNPNGCDTVITTTITLIGGDTTWLQVPTCNTDSVTTTITEYPVAGGCDSVVVTGMVLDPPGDTTYVEVTTCDSLAVGVWPMRYTGVDGGDSVVVETVTLGETDTTYTQAGTCDSLLLGTY